MQGFVEVVKEHFGKEDPVAKLADFIYESTESLFETINMALEKAIGRIAICWVDEGCDVHAPETIKGAFVIPKEASSLSGQPAAPDAVRCASAE